jgi:antitoxin component of RelBE/YafQ-DinJ toxin-antitoxin module
MEAIIIPPKNKEQSNLFEQLAKTLKIPFEKTKEKIGTYNDDFVSKMKESRQQAKEGKTVKINLDEIWK